MDSYVVCCYEYNNEQADKDKKEKTLKISFEEGKKRILEGADGKTWIWCT